MRLTRKKAIELCIELWTWCAKTGKDKEDWPEWEKYKKYARPKETDILSDCWFCEYNWQQDGEGCNRCPLPGKVSSRCETDDYYYNKWCETDSPAERKKYAKLFLAQIKKCK